MSVLRHFVPKPWFVWRPSQIGRRLLAGAMQAPAGFSPFQVAWGATIAADGRKDIGRSLRTIGTYDLAVSETLVRLLRPGDRAIDAGANIGYMSVLMASVVGSRGGVMSFEPHPELFEVLRRNLVANQVSSRVDARRAALGAVSGEADLVIPDDFCGNDGIAFMGADAAVPGRRERVKVECLDDAIGSAHVEVLKLDVEGFEEQVLLGAQRALTDARIRHVVFEDHAGAGSPVMTRLQRWGYTIFSLGWTMTGLRVVPVEDGRATSAFEAPSYLATLHPAHCSALLQGRGWRTLRKLAETPPSFGGGNAE